MKFSSLPISMRAALTFAGAVAAIALSTTARATEITLPRETAALKESPLPGFALAQTMCGTCHSAEYSITQPPASPRAYWQATVVKMQKVFAAPLPDTAIDPIVDYLVKTYGNERNGAAPAPAAPAPAAAAPAAKKA
jgi:mono/diheme cytochrome c family protein